MATFYSYDITGTDMTMGPFSDPELDLDSMVFNEFTDQVLNYQIDIGDITLGVHLEGYGFLYDPDPQVLEFRILDSSWNTIIYIGDFNYSFDDHSDLLFYGYDSPELLAGDDVIYSGDGNDILTGLDGSDRFGGAGGDDTIYAGYGDDVIYGEDGYDLLYGNQGDDDLYGGYGEDILYGGQDEDLLLGNQGDDLIYGHKGDDWIYGGQDDDLLYGNQGSDDIYGNKGNDSIWAGQDDDWIDGGEGDDWLWGNKGADYFYLSAGNDVIYDFSSAEGDFLVAENMSMLGYQQIGTDLLVSHNEGSVLLTNTMFGIDFSESADVIFW